MPEIVSEIAEIFIYRKVRDTFEYLLLKRNYNETYAGIWSIAGGKIEKDEKALEAALREMKEETGLKAKRLFLLEKVSVFFEHRDDKMHLVPVFLAEAKDNDGVILSEEHSEFAWMNFDEAYEKIHWKDWKKNLKTIHRILTEDKSFEALKEIIL